MTVHAAWRPLKGAYRLNRVYCGIWSTPPLATTDDWAKVTCKRCLRYRDLDEKAGRVAKPPGMSNRLLPAHFVKNTEEWFETFIRELMRQRTLVIIRGPSGSGKTTLARRIHDAIYPEGLRASTFAADDFFDDRDFDPKLLGEAHADCQLRVSYALQRRDNVVIVHNTGTRKWEIGTYGGMAQLAGYKTIVLRYEPEPEANIREVLKTLHERNVHNVPFDVVASMWARMEDIEGETVLPILRTSTGARS